MFWGALFKTILNSKLKSCFELVKWIQLKKMLSHLSSRVSGVELPDEHDRRLEEVSPQQRVVGLANVLTSSHRSAKKIWKWFTVNQYFW